MKPSSMLELSVQVRSISIAVVEALAMRLLGATGAGAVVALAMLELFEAPRIVLTARTR